MMLPILFKRSNSKEHINQWQIEVEGSKFRTITGFVGMKLFVGNWTECIPKNKGKKNATTAEEQALFEAKALWQKRKDLGYWEDINDCDKKVFFQPMLAADWNKTKSKINIKEGVYSDPKLDGIRCIVKSDGMWTRNGKELISTPHIFESLKFLFKENEDLILDGELYADKNICDFNTIVSCVRKTKPTQADLDLSKEYIKFWVYDCPSYDGIFSKRKQYLINLNLPNTCIIVNSIKCYNGNELIKLYGEYITEGYEGQMIRTDSQYENKRSKFLMKNKEFFDDEFIVLNIFEGVGKFQNKAATVLCNTKEGVEFKATINGQMSYLEEIWNNKKHYIGKSATIKYFEKTSDGSIRFGKVINLSRESYE